MNKHINTFFLVLTTLLSTLSLQCMKKETESNVVRMTGQKQVATDTQIYQLLSATTKDNPEFYLPHELVQIITVNTHELTQLNLYEKYGECVKDGNTLLRFINTLARIGMNITSTVNIVKACLYCSGKSLKSLRTLPIDQSTAPTVLHTAFCSHNVYCNETLCQIIDKDLKEFLYMTYPINGYMIFTGSIFTICKHLLMCKVTLDTAFFKKAPLSNWGNKHIEIILKYLNEEEGAQILFDSYQVAYDEIMREIENENGDDSID